MKTDKYFFTQSKAPNLPTIPESNKFKSWGWLVKPLKYQNVSKIPYFANNNEMRVLDGIKELKAPKRG